ncbi:MAG: HDOD domain-containing protein [Syntrophobacteraceae bacterium]|nr:HDOD domain-containing protein [Syntrophobacteraceae bacterium]
MIAPEKHEILHRMSQVKDLPPLPLSLQRLLEIVRSQVTTAGELESIILYDQSLASRILRVANSAYYGNRGKVTTVSRAISLMGFDQAKSICLLALLIEMFENRPELSVSERENLWKHAFCTARLAGIMAARRPWATREEANLFGLLHDLGKLVMVLYFHDYYREIQHMAEQRGLPFWCMELQFGLTHTQLGKWVAVKWSFPQVFQDVMEFHHTPWKSTSHRAEVKLITLADTLAHSAGRSDAALDRMVAHCCRDLLIGPDEWSEYQSVVREVWVEVEQLWGLLS